MGDGGDGSAAGDGGDEAGLLLQARRSLVDTRLEISTALEGRAARGRCAAQGDAGTEKATRAWDCGSRSEEASLRRGSVDGELGYDSEIRLGGGGQDEDDGSNSDEELQLGLDLGFSVSSIVSVSYGSQDTGRWGGNDCIVSRSV